MAGEHLTVMAQMPLDVELIVDADVLGRGWSVRVADAEGRMVMPVCDADVGSPIRAPKGFAGVRAKWGSWTSYSSVDGTGQAAVRTLAFELLVSNVTPKFPMENLDQGYVYGMGSLEEKLVAWTRRFQEWGGIVVRQSLSLMDPSPRTLSAPTARPVMWVMAGGVSSWPNTHQAAMTTTMETQTSAVSERVADVPAVDRMTALSNDATASAPAAIILIAAARRAAGRGRYRLALMELGTALELLLTDLLNLPGNHRETLGPLSARARRHGVALPKHVQQRFVKPRNDAVHGGIEPTRQIVLDALDMVDGLVAQHLPDYACDSTSQRAHRPQRTDLVIVKRPSAGTASQDD
jgi:hypothetical protein